ncbi:hypothetical protein Lal_00001201 [Lupinus albus]|uniref:Uncharacterized protein n=1 Tax=Lupinus albus TaxID=3870 RepID=A0A6A5P1C9_LUPAL|nr:hypothetical protein Lalb_Chr18g0051891 [Lupinus albus]KAF1891063.1 hypothetical protein Lal_00001201 [Lupinus albus]
MESFQKEKQIMVDPLSLKESFTKQRFFDTTMLQPVITTSADTNLHPPTLQPPRKKFLSLTLPNLDITSPRLDSALSMKKSEGESLESQCKGGNLTLKDKNMVQEVHLIKSKSFGERRTCAPSNELDHWLTMLNELVEHEKKYEGKISKTEAMKDSAKSVKHRRQITPDDVFRCNALCLFLPGFGNKQKPNKPRKEESQRETVVMSRTVSVEKFECGSWASSAMHYESEGESTKPNFGLPLELKKCYSMNEVYSTNAASFVFDKDVKGILKNGSSKTNARKSESPTRHVQFSPSSSPLSCPSSPSFCISPRLRKAREDFNAFLAAAQTA